MPEMPEVESVRRSLQPHLTGRQIINVQVDLPRLIRCPSPAQFADVLHNKRVQAVERRGKYLLLMLTDDWVLVVHLRMTGRLQYVRPGEEIDRFAHIHFQLDNGDCLIYADTRTLGTLHLLPQTELGQIRGLAGLGPEPLSAEFTIPYFCDMLAKRQSKIKSLLLNQQYVAGLGNIYVDESLAIAGIHPERTAASLTNDEVKALFAAINQVIGDGIDHGGTTLRDYLNAEGKRGSHQQHLLVYGRKDEPCRRCGTPIRRIELGGRGTHFCPQCQPRCDE